MSIENPQLNMEEESQIKESLKEHGEKSELKFADIYKSDEWKKFPPIRRAQLLLVAEGVKSGAIIGGDFSGFKDIVEKMGLEARLTTHPLWLDPVYRVSTPDVMARFFRNTVTPELELQKGDYWRIEGELLGYPECCIEEYSNPQKNIEARRKSAPNKNSIPSNLDFEMEQLFKEGKPYPEELDFRPPTFTPCSVHCEKALKMLRKYKEVLESADPEAAKALKEFQWRGDVEKKFHKNDMGEIDNKEREEREKERLDFLRKSV